MAAASADVGTLKAMFEHWDEATLAEVLAKDRAEAWVSQRALESIVMYTALPLLLMFHAPLSAQAFMYFDCNQLGEGKAFLRQDYSVQCHSAAWTAYLPVACALLVSWWRMVRIGYMCMV